MRPTIHWHDRVRSFLSGHPASTYATRRLAREDIHALEADRARAVSRLTEDLELLDRYVNPLERYMDGDRLVAPLGTILDRRSGKNLPLVWTELDLREFRRMARVICDVNPFAVGFLGLLTDFHLRQGFGWQAREMENGKWRMENGDTDTSPVVHKAQSVLDEWRNHQLWGLKSREAFRRWRRDGEVFLRFFRGGEGSRGLPVIRFVEPEQVGPPPGDDAEGEWSFGVRTDPEDIEDVISYFVRDPLGTGSEGDEVPADRIIHLKANVDSSIKRGLPDFLPVQDDLERVRRILRNMGEVAAVQTAIAWVSQYATATVEQVGTLIRAGSDYTRPKLGSPSGKLMDVVRYEPGTVLHMDDNRQFVPGPVGTGTPGFIQVEQAILRGCGARWRMPEYFSGDASNNNLASSITAGSPFVVAVEGTQLEWAVFERAVAMKVLELCVESGRLRPEDIADIDVKAIPPAVALANREEEERLRQMRHQAGVLSVTTWQQQVGLDPKHESANFAAETKRKAGGDRGDDSAGEKEPPADDGGDTAGSVASEGLVPAKRGLPGGKEEFHLVKPGTIGTDGWERDVPALTAAGGKKPVPGKGSASTAGVAASPVAGGKKASGVPGGKTHAIGIKKAPTAPGGKAPGGGVGGPSSPTPHNPDATGNTKVRDLKRFLRLPPAAQKKVLIAGRVLPPDWDTTALRPKDNKAINEKKIRAMVDHLGKVSSQDLYALIRHYGTQQAESKVKSWATTANEVLLNRQLQSLGAQLELHAPWDAVVPKIGAVVNYKLITAKGSTQDSFTRTAPRKVLDALRESKDHQDKPFARITLVAKSLHGKPHPDNGVYIHPDFGHYSYKQNRRDRKDNPHGWPIPVMTGEEFEKKLVNPAALGKTLSDSINDRFGRTPHGRAEQQKAREAMMRSKRVETEETMESAGKALDEGHAEALGEGKGLTKRLVGKMRNPAALQDVAAQAVDALPEKERAAHAAQVAGALPEKERAAHAAHVAGALPEKERAALAAHVAGALPEKERAALAAHAAATLPQRELEKLLAQIQAQLHGRQDHPKPSE